MSKYGMLDNVLNDILKAVTPLQEDWAVRFGIVNDLRLVAESVESLRGATVEPFGSFVSNLFTRWGDLDISIELSNGSHISSVGKKHKQTLLGDLLKALRAKGGWNNLQFIINARVPILKLKRYPPGISCDISINNLQGQMKSKILLWINKIDGRFHDMVLLVKEWAKAHKINNPKTGTFNSYSLSLLVIFHFQTCVPAILPPLKDIYPGNMVDDLIGVRADVEDLIAETCDTNINRYISDKSRPKNKKSLAELFVEFLRKFAQMDSWASKMGISPHTGQWEQIKDNTRWLPKTYAIFVEDPFEQPQNTARSVSSGHLPKIAKAFLETYSILISKSQTPNSLLIYLAPPHVTRYITKPAIPNYGGGYLHPPQPQVPRLVPAIPNYGGGYLHPPQPQVPRLVRPQPPPQRHPQQPPQHRIQNGSEGSSSNGSISGGSKGSSSNSSMSRALAMQAQKRQQIWRPRNQ
ncbi:protein HESO1 [Arachis stenosperma]|uniref:protein HESO1 n=1 Tax=Arachis stenosperma TaxID=217475 RepID=UPI0025AB814D|nr:protein HESO1 [Arachis stenosperma]XP_057749034.1 protein HESO1 [Arachis stenosperma]XP_057749035.1 protein HESO1 [Arachis stenosperma]XP_057749036.1 protein HESO1 [Arachis stenosperma]